jgi:hypothetical protein
MEEPWTITKWCRFPQLLNDPFQRWAPSYVPVPNASASVFNDHKHVEGFETNRPHNAKVHCPRYVHVVSDKRQPIARWIFGSSFHVFPDRLHIQFFESEINETITDLLSFPQGIFRTHLPDQFPQFHGNLPSPRTAS